MIFESLLAKLTIGEKAALVSGTEFWKTNKIPSLNIPYIFLSDGPHGLRKQSEKAGTFELNKSEPATSFPTAATVANSWNPKYAKEMGEAIAKECRHYDVNVLLGPGINIKRNPLCGRNFEYYSEDPLLTAKMGAGFVNGVQENGVAACIKHFAANNSEDYRFMGDSIVDERALREIYLKAFELIVKNARPRTIMSSYNKINGTYAAENKTLLTDILRTEWGFDGLVMSDWGGAGERPESLKAGLDLEMPGDYFESRRRIINAINDKTLKSGYLDSAAKRVLRLIDETYKEEKQTVDFEAHNALALKIAKDSAVLLKNDNNILPLKSEEKILVSGNVVTVKSEEKILVTGELFERMRYQGSGSSLINPYKLTSPKAAFEARKIKYEYVTGFKENQTKTDKKLLKDVLSAAQNYEKIIVFCGLTDYAEMEGCDRKNMALPKNQIDLINSLTALNKKVILVMFGGAPVELPFFDKISALLNMYLPGQNGGEAVASLIFGESSPCGKLSETWPLKYSDVPFYKNFSKNENELYKESIYVGYRYYDTAAKEVRFPFGFGLSYTIFEYSKFKIEIKNRRVKVACEITNTGACFGAETVQLYVKNNKNGVFKANKELQAFAKVYLAPGETADAVLSFNFTDLAYYNVNEKSYITENGNYQIQVGASSRDIKFEYGFEIADTLTVDVPYSDKVISAYSNIENGFKIDNEVFESLIGYKILPLPSRFHLTLNSRLSHFRKRLFGRLAYNMIIKLGKNSLKAAKELPDGPEKDTKIKNALFLIKILNSNSARCLSASSSGQFSYTMSVGFVTFANGRIFKGLKLIKTKEEVLPLPKDEGKADAEKT